MSLKTDFKLIPWEEARDLAEKFNQDMIVMLCYDSKADKESVITWGKETIQSDYAAQAGNKLKEVIGWPEDYRHDESAKVTDLINRNTTLIEACQAVRSKLLDNLGLLGGEHKLNDVFDILNKAIEPKESEEPK